MTERRTILHVDDEAALRLLFAAALKRATGDEFELLSAGSGEEALERLRAAPRVDLIVTDIRMPGMSGIELLTAVRKIHHRRPAVMLTAGTLDQAPSSVFGLGAAAIIQKPYSLGDVLKEIRDLACDRLYEVVDALLLEGEARRVALGAGAAELGQGGIAVRGADWTAGTELDLALDWPDGVATRARARCVWSERGRGCGLGFKRADRATDQRLREFVERERIRSFIPAL